MDEVWEPVQGPAPKAKRRKGPAAPKGTRAAGGLDLLGDSVFSHFDALGSGLLTAKKVLTPGSLEDP